MFLTRGVHCVPWFVFFVSLSQFQSIGQKRKLLHQKNCVYKIQCLICCNNTCYLGETGRKLSKRLNEHFTNFANQSYLTEVSRHDKMQHQQISRDHWRVTVVSSNLRNTLKRKLIESMAINTQKPILNKNAGLTYHYWTNRIIKVFFELETSCVTLLIGPIPFR